MESEESPVATTPKSLLAAILTRLPDRYYLESNPEPQQATPSTSADPPERPKTPPPLAPHDPLRTTTLSPSQFAVLRAAHGLALRMIFLASSFHQVLLYASKPYEGVTDMFKLDELDLPDDDNVIQMLKKFGDGPELLVAPLTGAHSLFFRTQSHRNLVYIHSKHIENVEKLLVFGGPVYDRGIFFLAAILIHEVAGHWWRTACIGIKRKATTPPGFTSFNVRQFTRANYIKHASKASTDPTARAPKPANRMDGKKEGEIGTWAEDVGFGGHIGIITGQGRGVFDSMDIRGIAISQPHPRDVTQAWRFRIADEDIKDLLNPALDPQLPFQPFEIDEITSDLNVHVRFRSEEEQRKDVVNSTVEVEED